MKKKLSLLLALTVVLGLTTPAIVPYAQAASTDATTTTTSPDATVQPPASDETATDPDVTTGEDDLSEIDPALLAEAEAMIAYADQLDRIAVYEDKAIDTYNKFRYVTSSNRKQAYSALTYTVIPNYTKFLASLKQIKPESVQLAKIHTHYIKAVSLHLEGMTLFKKYVSSPKLQLSILNKANQKIDAGMSELNIYKKAITAYGAKFES
ncbi:hypothetical protein [Paenibacillus wenxiniae]|uniref:Uncharacterized protein n=1 Tax=Paenibacillus wenxiniae TaxID=1636843 RepID=A0ABW4RE73_9BACL